MSGIMGSYAGAALGLAPGIAAARTIDDALAAVLASVHGALALHRSAILCAGPDGLLTVRAARGLPEMAWLRLPSAALWTDPLADAAPLFAGCETARPSLEALGAQLAGIGIGSAAFVPMMSFGRPTGALLLADCGPRTLDPDGHAFAVVAASLAALVLERQRLDALVTRGIDRLRFALESANMGTWEWNLRTNQVRWSENLERIHGLPPGTFDGTFASYQREIHPEDRERVLESARQAIASGAPHEVEYRIVAPDGTVRWCEGKGHVEYEDGEPVRMVGVCLMVTRRKEAELARLAAAEEVGRQKDEFLATLSHELRTPLNAILGWAQMLQAGHVPSERVTPAIQTIARNASLQARLIGDILDVSRIISGKLPIEPAPVAIRGLVEAVVTDAGPDAAAKRIDLTKSIEDCGVIEGDAKRLHQVLGNVLSNAIKFTPDGGRVDVRCVQDDQGVTIVVQDTGIGIPADFLPFVFDRFRQADSRSTRRHGGLGLGLAIARHLVEQHGGTIGAASAGPDLGTRVTIRLPAETAAGAAGVTRHPSDRPPDDVRLDGMTIMVVDDEPDSRELLAAIFERQGAAAIRCESADAALHRLQGDAPGLLVADIAMPDVDGNELMRRVRAAGFGLPAIAVTAYARPEDQAAALGAGYNAYCSKPVDAAVLLAAARRLAPAG